MLAELPTRAEREPVARAGRGRRRHDRDRRRGRGRVLARFDGLDARSSARRSASLGERRERIVVDPIDGSLNAKRGIPFFSLSIAVADGDDDGRRDFGYVYDFGAGEEWTARAAKARPERRARWRARPKDEIEILAFEATLTSRSPREAPAFAGVAHRCAIMGSLALSLCHLAAGRIDAVCSLKPTRRRLAAGQLLVRERGLAIDQPRTAPFGAAPLDLVARSRIAAAGTTELCRTLEAALTS